MTNASLPAETSDFNLVSGLTKLGNKEGESWVTLREAEAEAVCAELSKLHAEHLQDIERMDRAATAMEAYQAAVNRLREAMQFCLDNLDCHHVHHRKSEYHEDGPCPVMARLERVMVETL